MPADPLTLAGRNFGSRLIVGTGKYPSNPVMVQAHAASGTEMVTVAVRRVNLGDRSQESLLDFIDADKYFLLPNTAGCYTADDAVRTAHLAREVGLSNWVKLEVIGDERTLFPDNEALLEATRRLVRDDFVVLPLHQRRPGGLPQARGRRGRGRDAARRAHRLRAGHPERQQHPHHQGRGRRARHRGRRRRHAVGRRAGHGARGPTAC